MLYSRKKHSAFTLVELIVVVFIVGLLATSVRYINFDEISNIKRSEIFTAEMTRVLEGTRNGALLGRSIGLNNPDEWRINLSLANSGTVSTEYLSGSTWVTVDDRDFTFQVDFPKFISSVSCDVSGDIAAGTGTIVFKGRELSFTGACNTNDKTMTIITNYSAYSGEVLINAVSGVIESVD